MIGGEAFVFGQEFLGPDEWETRVNEGDWRGCGAGRPLLRIPPTLVRMPKTTDGPSFTRVHP